MISRHPDIDAHVCAIIPTYNNEGTIADVIRRTYAILPRVIVVNDGSTDATLKEIKTASADITIIDYKENRGKGYALVQGFRKAMQMGYDYAITIDADGQHYPEDIPIFLEAHYQNPDALIVGSRDLRGKDMSGGSVFANKFSNFWFTVQTAHPLPDTQTGYRLYPLHKLHWLNLITSRYEAELELMVYASWHGVELLPVPINVYYPPREERVSHFRPGADFARISLLNTALCFAAGFYAYPRKLFKGIRALVYSLIAIIVFLFGAFILSFTAVYCNIMHPRSEKHRMKFHNLLYRVSRWVINHIPGTRYKLNNISGETFEKPAVIICNHQSHLDLMCAMSLTPKMIIVTKRWVWNNPFYGFILRYAEFFPVTFGYEQTIEHCSELVKRGYSILFYPEGTRSVDCRIQKFHRGAFYLAEKLGLDIVPVMEYGLGKVLPKTGMYLRTGRIEIDIHPRVAPDDQSFGNDFRQRTKMFGKFYRQKYPEMAHRR